MPQAIYTKYLPATETKGSRIKASCDRGSLTIGYPHEFSGDEVHREAVRQLCRKFIAEDVKKYGTEAGKGMWANDFATGGLPKEKGLVHVFIN